VPLQFGKVVLTQVLTAEGLHAKRLELLSGKDWFNTPTPKPLEITFPSRKEVQMIGRRRKLTDKEKERHKERMRERKMNVSRQSSSVLRN
jgi:hypothetical protein